MSCLADSCFIALSVQRRAAPISSRGHVSTFNNRYFLFVDCGDVTLLTGLAATLAGLRADDWNRKRDRFGHLLESFVLQQLIVQAGWTDPDLRFWRDRDKDQVEVDCVITRGSKVWGIETKAAATVNTSDGRGLHRLAEQAKGDFQTGIILYDGDAVLPLGKSGFLAVPLSRLWEW